MTSFGKFLLLERLGDGGMAEVFLARPSDAAISKLVALKRISPRHVQNPYYQDMFRREAEIALRLRHPAIVTIYEMGIIEATPYMTMEFFPGKTLAELIRILQGNRGAISVASKISVIRNIADALQYIHDFSDYGEMTEIIHRDVSPHNIIVGLNGTSKLIDFGVARINHPDEATHSKELKGKIAYMSPEQIRGEALTNQTDVFSLGIILWELLAGQKLFTGTSVAEVSARVEACDLPALVEYAPDVPAELRTICRIALAKETKDRYRSALEFSLDLQDVLRKHYRDHKPQQLASELQALFPEDVVRQQTLLRQFELPLRFSPGGAGTMAGHDADILTPTQAIEDRPSSAPEALEVAPIEVAAPIPRARRRQASNGMDASDINMIVLMFFLCVVPFCALKSPYFSHKVPALIKMFSAKRLFTASSKDR